MSTDTGRVRLTDLASCGGCAAKYSAARLEELLKGFVPVEAENLLVGLAPADDAAVYRIDDERAIIFTLDFFPPVVDDPATTARSPRRTRSTTSSRWEARRCSRSRSPRSPRSCRSRCSREIFAAADAQVRAAGGLLAGGHTIRDAEPKYGLAVVGTVHPDGIWPKNGARPGDALFLTKPLGTGLIMTGVKRGIAGTQPLERAIRWMRTLNKDAADVMRPFAPNAVTDVTGFGLFGHAHEVAERSGVRVVLESERCPRSTARSTSRARACARAAIRATATSRPRTCRPTGSPRRTTRSATTRRPPAGCSSRCRRTRRRRSRPRSRRSTSSCAASAASRKEPESSST